MTVSKELKFKFAMDDQSFQSVKRALDELAGKAANLAKALQGVGGSVTPGQTGGVGGVQVQTTTQKPNTTPISQAIKVNLDAFKNLTNLGSTSLQGLTNALKNNVQQQLTQINNLKQALQALGNTYNNLGGQGPHAAAVQSKMVQVAGMITSAQRGVAPQANALAQATGPLLPGIPWPAGAGAGGTGGGGAVGGGMGGWGNFIPPQFRTAMGVMGTMGVAGAVTHAPVALMRQSQGWNNAMLDQEARRGRVMSPGLDRLMSADVSDMLKTRELAQMTSQDRVEALRREGSVDARVLAGLSGAAQTARAVVGMGGSVAGLSDVSLDTDRMERMIEMREKLGERTAYKMGTGRGYKFYQDTAGTRLQLARTLGMGVSLKDPQRTAKDARGVTEFMAQMHESGFSPEEYMGAAVQARQIGGRGFERQYAGTIMRASAAGYGQLGDVLSAAERSEGVGRGGAAVRNALAGIETGAGLQLGQSLFGFDPRGQVSGAGALQAIQQGFNFTGTIEDRNLVARAQMGIQAADRLGRGFDPYQKGMNLVSAIQAMPGGTTYQQDALAGMSFKDLAAIAAGKTSARGEAFGISKEQALAQISGQTHGLFSRYVEQGGKGTIADTMRAMRASGKSEQEFIAELGAKAQGKGAGAGAARKQLEALDFWAANEMGEEGPGMIQALSGVRNLGGKLKEGKMPSAGIDDLTRKQLKAEADQMRESGKQMAEAIAGIVDSLAKIKDEIQVQKSFGELATNADMAAERLYKLATVPETELEKGRGSTTKEAIKTATKNNPVTSAAVKTVAGVASPLLSAAIDAWRLGTE